MFKFDIQEKYNNLNMLINSNKQYIKEQLDRACYLEDNIKTYCTLTYGPFITKKYNADIILKLDDYSDISFKEGPYYVTSNYVTIFSNREKLLLTEYLYYYLKYTDINFDIDISNLEIKIPSIQVQNNIISYCKNNDELIFNLKNYIEENETLIDKVNMFVVDITKKVKIID